MSSIKFSILLLQIQAKMINPLNKQFKMNFQIWQQVPVSSELLSMIFDGDSDFFKSMIGMDQEESTNSEIDTKKEAYDNKVGQKDKLDDKVKNRNQENAQKDSKKDGKKTSEDGKMTFENKFKFDGDFFSEISDENRKYNVNYFKTFGKADTIKYNLLSLFNQPEYKLFFESERENETVISADEVVSSIQDWIDEDDERSGFNGGSEDDRYAYLKHKYRNKNDKLVSFQELYRIYGIDDDLMAAFGESLTVYGKNEININTCDEALLRSIILGVVKEIPPSYLEPHSQEMAILVSEIIELRTLSPFSSEAEFYGIISKAEGITLDPTKKPKFKLITNSTIFRITGYGNLNEAVSKITVVFDSENPDKQYLYYREE
jgi:hypothetical protein